MEQPPNFENREKEIDLMIERFAEQEEMPLEDIRSDFITFAPYPGNEENENPAYFEEVAERLGVAAEELIAHAVKKAKEEGLIQ